MRDIFIDNAGNNGFYDHDGNDRFSLGAPDDFVRGGKGADMFLFVGTTFANDRTADFNRLEGDKIDILAATNFSQLILTNATIDGQEAVRVGFCSSNVTLIGWSAGELLSSDFIF